MSKYDGDVYYVGSWSKTLLESGKKNKLLRPLCRGIVTIDIVVRKSMHHFVSSGQLVRTLVFIPVLALTLFIMFSISPSGVIGSNEDTFLTLQKPTPVAVSSNESGWYEDDLKVFHITSEKGLQEFASRVNRGNVSIDCQLEIDLDMTGKEFIQAADTGLNGSLSYIGCFDGQGHKITGLSFEQNTAGLFGRLGSDACVKDLTVQAKATGNEFVSCIAARNSGTISGCSVIADLNGPADSLFIGGITAYNDGEITDCTSTGTFSGGAYIGGIVGTNNGHVSGCSFDGSVSGELSCGGIAGHNETGTISDCSNSQDTTVSATAAAGGICGNNSESAEITDCLSRGSETSKAGSGRICGISYGSVTSCFFSSGNDKQLFNTSEIVGINYGVIEGTDDTSD